MDGAEKLWKMQVEAFQDLHDKYQDTETSPATEQIEKIIMRLNQSFTYYYFVDVDPGEITADACDRENCPDSGHCRNFL